MKNNIERRKKERIELKTVVEVLRMCDIAVMTGKEDVDVTIRDISTTGMGIEVSEETSINRIDLGDNLFIRGCIFNDNIGFLSSQKASVVWKCNNKFGLRFTPELDINLDGIREMLIGGSYRLLH
ncbi:PilZ domain-containing protein [Maridesulfovibrio bastinii]|uniref:PilZ domain-containing protein n=1 Tax=Maridesulfovibrio bastinii TaxID=47157 RepID=UPI0004118B57|nr:PilZ domain-containing protein [Maridesulfovibrio bastinii]